MIANPDTCLTCTDGALRAIADALAMDDLDRAMALGLLDARPDGIPGRCGACDARTRIVIAARDERLRALAARERHRARQARLAERMATRARRREAAAPAQPSVAAPSLPPAAAAALARAKARVAAKRTPG